MEGKPSILEMATETESDVISLKGTKILVVVEDALADVIVVTYNIGNKIFQGALLDITKKNAPYGIVPPAPPPPEEVKEEKVPTTTNYEKVDKLYAVKQRHTYYQIPAGTTYFINPIRRAGKDKNVRMRRLRPRKVLCSNCQEVVMDRDGKKNTVSAPTVTTRNTSNKSGSSEQKSGAIVDSNVSNQRILTRRSKTDPSLESVLSNDSADNSCNASGGSDNTAKDSNFRLRLNTRSEKMILRKRKSTEVDNSDSYSSLPEKLKRTDVLRGEATDSGSSSAKAGLSKTSPVIKISFANPQGKDTVLKIPARIKNASDTEEDSNWSLQENSDYNTKNFSSAKAAKKALKKAKKEAQRRAATVASSPSGTTVLSPSNGEMHGSEREMKHHHHKHKVKRKKKHKEGEDESEKLDDENTNTRNVFISNGTGEGWCLRTSLSGEVADINKQSIFEDVKNKCLHQKLSISLKRLNAKAYMRCSPKYSVEEDSIASDDISNISACSGSGDDSGEVPDFLKLEAKKKK